MEISSVLVFIALYLYAFLFQPTLLWIFVALIVLYTVVHYYVSYTNKVPLHHKIVPSFYLEHSLGAVLATVEVDMKPLDDFIEE